MGATFSVVKTLVIPGIIALFVYLVLTYVVVPLWQRYRSRYSQYLPLDTISTQTSSFRHRIQHAIARVIVPSSWRQGIRDRLVVGADSATDADYDSEDGEELGDFDDDQRRQLSHDGRRDQLESTPRLSRDLEQGFMDDSDDDSSGR